MCGITGFVTGKGNAATGVYEGLLRLEYRGYDSAGISVLKDGKIVTVKRSGRVEGLKGYIASLEGNAAIGHTRWATHGVPSDVNAHPHNCGAFSVVHNGIIENYAELKAELIARGHVFLSQTDSEVVAHLLDENFRGDLMSAVAQTVKRLKGSFALAIMCRHYNGFIAVRCRSSLLICTTPDGVYAASDVPALPAGVQEMIVMEDGDIAAADADGVKFYDFMLNPVSRKPVRAERGDFSCDCGEYPHFMLKEINQSARTVRDTAQSFCRSADRKKLKELLGGADEVIVTGCGTAYNSGLLAATYISKYCGLPARAEIASELRYYPPERTGRLLVIAVSQSGETADTVGAVELLRQRGAKVIAVTNCGYSAITRLAHMVIPVCAGAEICVAATKSYLGQLAALWLISRVGGDVAGAESALWQVADRLSQVIACREQAELFAGMCASADAVFFLGRGEDYFAAVEASLKLKEVSYIFSDAYPAGELKHGTLALIDENTLSIFIICEEKTAEKCISSVHEVMCRGGRVAIITDIADLGEEAESVPVWRIPRAENLSPMLSAAALQLVAYYTAVMLGRDPDKPRNLAKSVTVE